VAIERDITTDDHWFTNEDKRLVFTIYQADGTTPQDISTWSFSWLLKRKQWDADVDALVAKIGPGSPAEITLTTPLSGVCTVAIVDSDTVDLAAGTYYHELKRVEDGLETVLSFGTVKLKHSIHRS
jgi:hypothetical protein